MAWRNGLDTSKIFSPLSPDASENEESRISQTSLFDEPRRYLQKEARSGLPGFPSMSNPPPYSTRNRISQGSPFEIGITQQQPRSAAPRTTTASPLLNFMGSAKNGAQRMSPYEIAAKSSTTVSPLVSLPESAKNAAPQITPRENDVGVERYMRQESRSTASTPAIFKSPLVSTATQTGTDFVLPSSATRPNGVAQSVPGVQADFMRNVVEDCLDEFEERWRTDCYSFYAKMINQMTEFEYRMENMIGTERLEYTRRLTEDNERLRAENERLKAMQFGKFFGPP